MKNAVIRVNGITVAAWIYEPVGQASVNISAQRRLSAGDQVTIECSAVEPIIYGLFGVPATGYEYRQPTMLYITQIK
jgi:hypothetical protein